MSYGHDHVQAKGHSRRTVGSKVRVETNGQMDRQTEPIALPASLTQSVKIFHQTDASSQCTYVAGLVVLVAVGKHELKVVDALLSTCVVEYLEALPDRAHVHRTGYHLVIVLPHQITQTAMLFLHTRSHASITHIDSHDMQQRINLSNILLSIPTKSSLGKSA